jgi:hypothetical protein
MGEKRLTDISRHLAKSTPDLTQFYGYIHAAAIETPALAEL